ncbi:hypothetical protein KIPB_010584, partial [Kipferlia bialata]|eukprot:g10584.t1
MASPRRRLVRRDGSQGSGDQGRDTPGGRESESEEEVISLSDTTSDYEEGLGGRDRGGYGRYTSRESSSSSDAVSDSDEEEGLGGIGNWGYRPTVGDRTADCSLSPPPLSLYTLYPQ